MDGTFDYRRFDVFVTQRKTGVQTMIQGFVEIHNHHDTCLNCNAEQSDITDPHRYAEVVAKQPLKNEAAGQRVDSGENEEE